MCAKLRIVTQSTMGVALRMQTERYLGPQARQTGQSFIGERTTMGDVCPEVHAQSYWIHLFKMICKWNTANIRWVGLETNEGHNRAHWSRLQGPREGPAEIGPFKVATQCSLDQSRHSSQPHWRHLVPQEWTILLVTYTGIIYICTTHSADSGDCYGNLGCLLGEQCGQIQISWSSLWRPFRSVFL